MCASLAHRTLALLMNVFTIFLLWGSPAFIVRGVPTATSHQESATSSPVAVANVQAASALQLEMGGHLRQYVVSSEENGDDDVEASEVDELDPGMAATSVS